MTTNIVLDDLAIIYTHDKSEFDKLIDLLNKLHERGFYRRLHLCKTIGSQEVMNQLATRSFFRIEQTRYANFIFGIEKS